MGFAFSKNMPILEIMFSNNPIAVFITKGPKVELIKIKPILDKCFVCKYGWFYLDPAQKIPIGRTFLYFYTGHNINPISIPAIKEIELYLTKHNKHEISEPLEAWVEVQLTEQEQTDRQTLEQPGDHNLLEKEKEKEATEQPTDTMANMTGEFNPQEQEQEPEPDPVQEERTKLVLKQMRAPINIFVERYLTAYGQSNPGAYRIAMKEVKLAKKQLDNMESKTMKSVIPLGIIAAVMIGATLLLSNLGSIQTNLGNIIPEGGLFPTAPAATPPPPAVTETIVNSSTQIGVKLIAYLGVIL